MGKTAVAVVTQGFMHGGGVPTLTRWLADSLNQTADFEAHVIDLATSRTDSQSRRLVDPPSWRRPLGPVRTFHLGYTVESWGANLVEVEIMRYARRRPLTQRLNQFDLIQVIAGTPAVGAATRDAEPPRFVSMATFADWEREQLLRESSRLRRAYLRANLTLVSGVEQLALNGVCGAFVLNRQSAGRARGMTSAPVTFAPPGVDVDRFQPHPAGWQRSGPIVCVSRLNDPRKGLDRVIDSYARLRRAAPCGDLVLAGRGRLPDRLHGMICDLGLLQHVQVMSDVDNVVNLLQESSVFVQASYEEGFGIAVLEAMACGLPVVATTTAGTLETVIEGRTGYLIEQSGEPATALAEAAKTILMTEDSSMSTEARSRAASVFSTDVCLARFTDAYAKAVR